MFLYIAKLGGAQNVEEFLINGGAQLAPQPDMMVDQQAAAGNLVPASALQGGNGVVSDPGSRMAGAM